MRRYTIQQNSVGNISFTDLDNPDGSFNLIFGATPVPKRSTSKIIFQDLRGVAYQEFLASEIESVTDKNGTTTVINGDIDLLYNTLTGTFFFKVGFIPSGSGYPTVNNRNSLPTDILTAPIGEVYLAENPVTNIFTGGQTFKTNTAGLYIRDTDNGNLNDWRSIPFKISFTDLEFKMVNDLVRGKQGRFILDNVPDGETTNILWPTKNIDLTKMWLGNEGVVKINSGDAGVKPTITVLGGGVFSKVIYTTPLVFSTITRWPGNILTPSESNIYDSVNDSFIENELDTSPEETRQGHLWRIEISFTKQSNRTPAFSIQILNPLSGFILEDTRFLPDGLTSGSIEILFETISDSVSLPAPIGTGQGYEIQVASKNSDTLDIVVESITRTSLSRLNLPQ